MEIKAIGILEIEVIEILDKNYLNVNCKYGTFIGKWMDEDIPKIGKCFAEIDYNEIINYKIIDEIDYCIKSLEGKNIIEGLIIKEDDDFIQYLDFCGDGIIMIEIKENNLKNKCIKLEVDEIEIWPVYF